MILCAHHFQFLNVISECTDSCLTREWVLLPTSQRFFSQHLGLPPVAVDCLTLALRFSFIYAANNKYIYTRFIGPYTFNFSIDKTLSEIFCSNWTRQEITEADTLSPQEICLRYIFSMSAMASQLTSLTIVYSTVYCGADQRKHQSSASLDFVCGIHRGPVNSPHKWPVTRKMLPFDDVIMHRNISCWPQSIIQSSVERAVIVFLLTCYS